MNIQAFHDKGYPDAAKEWVGRFLRRLLADENEGLVHESDMSLYLSMLDADRRGLAVIDITKDAVTITPTEARDAAALRKSAKYDMEFAADIKSMISR